MAITGVGGSYINSAHNNLYATKSKETEATTQAEKSNAQTTASDVTSSGLEFIQSVEKQNSGTKFFVGTVSYGQIYGDSSNISFVVDPRYLATLGSDPEAQKQFAEEVEYFTNCSKQFAAQQKAAGWEVVSDGWFCDKDGNWGGWTITRKTDKSSFLQEMTDKTNKIMEKKMKDKQERKDLEEKREISKEEKMELKEMLEKAGKTRLGDRFKGVTVLTEEEAIRVARESKMASGIYLDKKI